MKKYIGKRAPNRIIPLAAILFIVCQVGFLTKVSAQLDAPSLTSTVDGLNVSISWTQVDEASGYTFYYAPYPLATPIYQLDMGTATTLSAQLWNGAAYYVASQAYNGAESSSFSNIDYVVISDATKITLQGSSISVSGSGAAVDGTTVTITAPGAYTLQGTLTDGQVIVDAADEGDVTLTLNGIDITNSDNAPLFIKNSERTVIVLAAGSENTLTDGSAYLFDDPDEDEPDAALFSKSDLVVKGSGSLTINANYNDALKSKDGLEIVSGAIVITTVDDGIIGRDYISVAGGAITITAAGDGLKSTNDEDTAKGYILVSGGLFDITAASDGIQAETDITISGGDFTLLTGGGSAAPLSGDDSAKGVKAGGAVTISGGTFSINSADDAIHSNGDITVGAGTFNIASGDDGFHADAGITINDGTITITESYEGIEGATLTINGGDIHIAASDDGLNAAGGTDGSGMNSPKFGNGPKDSFSGSGDYHLTVNGGTIVVDADGDGIDINGTIEMAGGLVIVNGPTTNANGALDFDGSFTITGGTLIAAGSSGMAQAPGNNSTQYSVLAKFKSTLSASTLVNIRDSMSNDILTFSPSKAYQSIVFSSPDLESGVTYALYYGGSASGTSSDGHYQNAVYTGGTQYSQFTISSVTTWIQ